MSRKTCYLKIQELWQWKRAGCRAKWVSIVKLESFDVVGMKGCPHGAAFHVSAKLHLCSKGALHGVHDLPWVSLSLATGIRRQYSAISRLGPLVGMGGNLLSTVGRVGPSWHRWKLEYLKCGRQDSPSDHKKAERAKIRAKGVMSRKMCYLKIQELWR